MKKLVLSALVLAGLMLTSCDKNDDNNTTEEGTVDVSKMYLPLKITANGYSTNYTYNNKGQLTKIAESDGYEYTFSYSGNQLVEFTEKEGANKTTYNYSQTGNTVKLNAEEVYNGETYSSTATFEVDEKGNLINDGFFTYSYDQAGNNIKVVASEDSVANLTFDTKNGIFKNLNIPKWVSNWMLGYNTSLVNNALTFSFASEEDPEDNNAATLSYEYNADGYPIKMTALSQEDGSESQTIEYTKK